jgi:hypothetical protein
MAAMTRQEILEILILQARQNGFEFRKWYVHNLESSWTSFEAAVANLARGKRYYCLLFSHTFARHFWSNGGQMTFIVPTSTYIRHNPSGTLTTVTRKAFTRRTMKPDAWRYHLKEMAGSDDALQYIRRFIVRREDLEHLHKVSKQTQVSSPETEDEAINSSIDGPAA